jgi:hypothetical protein
MAAEFCLRNISIHARKVLLHPVDLRHGTDGFTSPPTEVVLRIFITLKNPSTSAGIEPANLGSSGEHASPLVHRVRPCILYVRTISCYLYTSAPEAHRMFSLAYVCLTPWIYAYQSRTSKTTSTIYLKAMPTAEHTERQALGHPQYYS